MENVELGAGVVTGNTFGATKGAILTASDFSFATRSAFAVEANWSAGIIAGNVIPLGEVDEVEAKDVEVKMYDAQSGYKKRTMPGIHAFAINMDYSEDQVKMAKALEGQNFRMFLFDYSNKVKGVLDGVTIKGYKIKPIYVDVKRPMTDKPGHCVIYIQLSDINEVEKRTIILEPSWSVEDLQPITKVVATAGAVANNAFTLDVAFSSDSYVDDAGVALTQKINGLLAANIVVLTSAGALRTTTATASTTVAGRYAIAGTTISATDTVQILPSATMLYKSEIVTLTA